MPRKPLDSTSALPAGCEKPIGKTRRVDLLKMTRLLLDHVTPALCEAVFQRHRTTERTRTWTFYAGTLFWAAMIVRHPPSLHHGLDHTRKGRGRDPLWPRVLATPQAFFQKAQGLRPHLFQATYAAFTRSLLPHAQPVYASWLTRVRPWFPAVLIVDGSRLDAIGHRLKLLRHDPAVVLPGCLTVFYDLFRGITRHVLFFPTAAAPEWPRGQGLLKGLAKGTLRLGDRLDAWLQSFHLLARWHLAGVFRLNGRLTLKHLRLLSRQQGGRSVLEEGLVDVGCGVGQPTRTLRLMRYRAQGHRLDLLTNVLDPTRLQPEDALALSRLRWSVERLFLDLKETLDLHGLYASHPNLVAKPRLCRRDRAYGLSRGPGQDCQAGPGAPGTTLPGQTLSQAGAGSQRSLCRPRGCPEDPGPQPRGGDQVPRLAHGPLGVYHPGGDGRAASHWSATAAEGLRVPHTLEIVQARQGWSDLVAISHRRLS